MLRNVRYPIRIIKESVVPFILIALALLGQFFLSVKGLPENQAKTLSHTLQIIIMISVSLIVIKGSQVGRDFLYDIFDTSHADNIRQRRLRTQIDYLHRIVLVFIFIATSAAILMTFEGARRIGASLIASAGVAGVVIGFAAQKSLANLIAGFQIAFTQPMRLDDVVIAEKEWGRVEEITLTYVVIRIWDDRRLVLPITYFIEKPFENWTRTSSSLLVPFSLYVDFQFPVESLRKELEKVTRQNRLWDKRVCILQVTNFTETAMELRALVSARNASEAFDLKCELREQLIWFIQSHYSAYFPQTRNALSRNSNQISLKKEDLVEDFINRSKNETKEDSKAKETF